MRIRSSSLGFAFSLAASSLVPIDASADEPAYRLRAETDVPALAVGAVFEASWVLGGQLQGPYCAPKCDPSTLDAIDRGTAGRYSAAWNRASDIGILALLAAEAGTLVGAEGVMPALNDAVVLGEAVIWSNALSTIANFAVRRPRPFTYGENAPLDARTSGTADLSFFSGHTTVAFAASTALFVTLRKIQPKGALPWIALGTAALGSAFIGASRILAGYHFPTDVFAGATVGVSLGVLIPALHDTHVAVAPLPDVTGRTSGVSIVGKL